MSDTTKRILVVDDDEIVIDIARHMLQYLGYEVSIATEGMEAVELYQRAVAERDPYSAVIMDLNIPRGIGGVEAAAEVLKINDNARIIVSSGNPCDPVMEKYDRHGFCGCIAKPFDLKDLQRAVDSALQGEQGTSSANGKR